MKLIEMRNWEIKTSEELWGLVPFSELLKRDKTKDKQLAMKELLFVYFFVDVKSDYLQLDPITREKEIKKDIGLPEDWELDKVVSDCIELYEKLTTSVIQKLYRQTIKAASDIGDYLENTKSLLDERDLNGKPVTDISKITMAIQRVPKLMSDLSAAYKEVVKEQESMEGKKKGSQSFNTFEQGLTIE